LGKVEETALVKINGQKVGTYWLESQIYPIPSIILKKKNTLEIEVSNLSANRIIWLDNQKFNRKKFEDINFVNKNYKPFEASSWKITDSGLMGPVRIYW